MNLGLGGFVARDGVGARQAGDPLTEGVAGDIASHVFRRVEEWRGRVPAAEVFTGCGQAGELTEGLEDAVLVEIEEEGVVLLKLYEHGSVEQLHVFVVELCKRSGGDRGGGAWRGHCVRVAKNGSTGSEGCAAFEKCSTAWRVH